MTDCSEKLTIMISEELSQEFIFAIIILLKVGFCEICIIYIWHI